MFSPRHYLLTTLTIVLAALLGFCGGRFSVADRRSSAMTTPRQNIDLQPVVSKSVEPAKSVAMPEPETLEGRWTKLVAQPATPAGESELAALIEKMAGHDPQRAISLAAGQANLRLRAALLRAALKGWGAADPEAAVAWAQTETVMDQPQAINALLQGAIQNPEKAVSVTTTLIQNDSSRAGEFGSDLISALTEAGQFERAANFAGNGAANNRDDWMLAAYSRWAEFQPQAALAGAMQITDPILKKTARDAVVVGWSRTDPNAMAEFAINNFSDAAEKSQALAGAISYWADNDPVAAADWINQNDPGAVSDSGVAEIALSPELVRKPEVAASWAESILNPQLRLDTLTAVLKKWAELDLSAAESYVANSPALAPEDRTMFRAALTPRTEP